MVVEHFKDADPVPIYQRLANDDRALPDGLRYVGSWVEVSFARCWQLMECDSHLAFMTWVMRWRDLTTFEVIPVVPSAETRELMNIYIGGPDTAA